MTDEELAAKLFDAFQNERVVQGKYAVRDFRKPTPRTPRFYQLDSDDQLCWVAVARLAIKLLEQPSCTTVLGNPGEGAR